MSANFLLTFEIWGTILLFVGRRLPEILRFYTRLGDKERKYRYGSKKRIFIH